MGFILLVSSNVDLPPFKLLIPFSFLFLSLFLDPLPENGVSSLPVSTSEHGHHFCCLVSCLHIFSQTTHIFSLRIILVPSTNNNPFALHTKFIVLRKSQKENLRQLKKKEKNLFKQY